MSYIDTLTNMENTRVISRSRDGEMKVGGAVWVTPFSDPNLSMAGTMVWEHATHLMHAERLLMVRHSAPRHALASKASNLKTCKRLTMGYATGRMPR